MAQVPTGTIFSVASTYSADIVVSAISNAVEGQVTATAHKLVNGDLVEVSCSWGRLNKRYARVKNATQDNFLLEQIDTSRTDFFPPGGGTGTVRKVTAWTQISGVLSAQSSGGDPKSVTYKYLESDVENSINDGFGATSYTLELDADAIGSPGYTALRNLTEVQTNTCLLMQTRNGGKVYRPCTVALNESIKIQDGQVNRVSVAFNGNNRLTRYAN